MHPVAGKPITTAFREEGSLWSLGWHTGVDYACDVGTDVLAPAPGYVIRASYDQWFGNYILLRCVVSGVPYNVYLCHLSKFLVSAGATVKMGQHIGESGATGNVSGPHVHMETRKAPYGFNGTDIVNPKVVYTVGAAATPPPPPLVLPVTVWNIARPRWYTPWVNRRAEVQREIRGESKLYLFQELFEESVIADIAAALPECGRVAGRAGLEAFYNKIELRVLNSWNHYSGIANRWAQEIEFEDRATGIRFTALNIHAPIKAEGDTAKYRYGKWLQGIEADTKYKTIIGGDTNVPSDSYSPKKELRAIGYLSYKEQAAISNEGTKDFITKNQDLCDIRTRPGRVSGGEVDVSTNELESDHRRIEATVVIAA